MIPLLVLLSGPAFGQAASLDVEILRPSFEMDAVPGVADPRTRPGTIRAGLLGQYTRDPLVLYDLGEERGTVLSHRWTAFLGGSVDLSRRWSVHAVLPVAWQAGSDVERWAADGPGMGDPSVGAGCLLASGRAGAVGLVADAFLPFGSAGAWLGEEMPRLSAGAVGLLGGTGVVDLLLGAGVVARASVDTSTDLEVGPEAGVQLALRYHAWPGRVSLWTGVLHRSYLQADAPGNRVAEALVGAWVTPSGATRWDLGVGKGFASGYGTTEFRGFVGLTRRWSFTTAARAEPTVVWVPGREPVREEPPEPLEEVSWAPLQLARIRASAIEIREPIQFRFATDEVLEVSLPTLHAVADILATHPEIGQVVVEGHASEEGSFPYNYDLSLLRARAVLQVLVEAGVHPRRLACRGMGEVAPAEPGTDEGSLALNRRVAFRIVERRDPLDPVPDLGAVVVPWTGGPPVRPEGP